MSSAEDFAIPWRFWKWRIWCDLEDIDMSTMKREDFCFRSFISFLWVIGNTVLLKGAKVILRKNFQVVLISKPTHTQNLRVKPLEISCSSVNFFSDRDKVLLVSKEFVLTKELGFRQCELPTMRNMIALRNLRVQISDRCCALRQLSRYLIHITVISLGAFMSYHVGLHPGYK